MSKRVLQHHWAVSIPLGLFLLLKFSTLSVRLSDTNIYFYTAHQLLNGELLYRDIFFTNFPVFPYISSVYLFLSGSSVPAYYFSAALEIAVAGLLIYAITYTIHKSRLISMSVSTLYLFSFIVLSTSDHQTGVFLASLFSVLSYFLFLRKKYILVGIMVALALFTKAYFLPLAASYAGYFILTRQWQSGLRFIAGFILTAVLVTLPFLLFARSEFIADVFSYSLTRGAGTDKFAVLRFFAWHDIALFVAVIAGLATIKKHVFFGLFSLFSIVFIIVYQDIYYLYLNFMVPMLIVFLAYFYNSFRDKLKPTALLLGVCSVAIVNIVIYHTGYSSLQKIENIEHITTQIQKTRPNYIYGVNDSAPLFAFLTHTPLLDNITDTNTNIFRKGLLDAETLTRRAIEEKAVVILHGAEYPHLGISEIILDEIVIKEKIIGECSLIGKYPVRAEGIVNRLTVFTC